MKKITLLLCIASSALVSCVSMKEYESLQSQYTQANKSWNLTKQELQELREENAELVRQSQAMNVQVSDLERANQECETTVTSLNRAYAQLQLHYDTTVENYMQQITGKNRDLSKANKALEQRNKEITEKERAFNIKEKELKAQQADLEERSQQMEQNEKAISDALTYKQRELEQLRQAVAKALVGFTDKGLNVETKDGKVYVSMEDKLLFASGSWTISDKGLEALKTLAKVLEDNPSLNVMVEGHTDNDAYHGTTAVKDNWDLSVMRATSIVKQLLKQGPKIDPARVVAAGHAEYEPLVRNTSAANKAKNRRTEIILTPKITDVLQLLKK